MAGGATICCAAFDPTLFWDLTETASPTWYYASPTMHSLILAEASDHQDALVNSHIRLICNAAGGLLPSLACQLRDVFGCVVLPSYGMTECMPISSPPLDYRLERSGTSGISVGPELSIMNQDDVCVQPGTVGRIAVRGAPLFGGYLTSDGQVDRSSITNDGWFDTGDMGYLDSDGYLHITGRNKEVINRGGELISPFEVEEAIMTASQDPTSPFFGRVTAALAFSVPHDTLQEVVGIALTVPSDKHRPCIRMVQEAVRTSLNQVKWPVFVVYMDDLPKNNNKIVRVKLAERLGLEQLSTNSLPGRCHWEAVCPPPNTTLREHIVGLRTWPDEYGLKLALKFLLGPDHDVCVRTNALNGFLDAFVAPAKHCPTAEVQSSTENLLQGLEECINGQSVPGMLYYLERPILRNVFGEIEQDQLDECRSKAHAASGIVSNELTATEMHVAQIFAAVLQCDAALLSADSDFFQLGGDSLRAGRLLSQLRKVFVVKLPIDILFTRGDIGSIASTIDGMRGDATDIAASEVKDLHSITLEHQRTCSSTNPFLLMIQLIPIIVLYPMKRALMWTIFLHLISATSSWSISAYLLGRLVCLIFSLAIGRAITAFISPFIAIATKWIIIGKYKPGLYPMWGVYHTRWWFVQKVIAICGRGHFQISNDLLVLYYRMLGAKVGQRVKIHPGAVLGEYDLLEIGDDVDLNKCTCRAFAAERATTMFLGRITLGKGSSVGLGSIVAPGANLSAGTCIGPNSSSWEIEDADESNRDLSSNRVPVPNLWLDILCYFPVALLVSLVQGIPRMAGLIGIVIVQPKTGGIEILNTIDWFAQPHRIAYHYLALILNSYFGPIFWFAAVWAIKISLVNTIFGPQRMGPAKTRSQLQIMRAGLLKRLVNAQQFHKLAELFGSHYEMTSRLYRALGAKIGQRVYWPGTGPTVQDFEMLNIGDDVVFGSRSHIVTSDGYGTSPVSLGNNSMVSDRVVVAPGVTLGERTVLGSGALTLTGKHYESDTVWVGSKGGDSVSLSRKTVYTDQPSGTVTPASTMNEKKSMASLSMYDLPSPSSFLSDDVTSFGTPTKDHFEDAKPSTSTTINITSLDPLGSPGINPSPPKAATAFGRAFYDGVASYRVWGMPSISCYCAFITIFTAFYWNVASATSIQIVAHILKLTKDFGHIATNGVALSVIIYIMFTVSISVLLTTQAILALGCTIGAKKALIGTRRPGNYDWDKSSYCQRWQLFLTIERLRRCCYGGQGILSLLTGTHYMVMYYRLMGAKIGQDVALFASGNASCLLTEPDLLTIGDRVAIDDASLVGHINSRGKFDLNELHVGSGAVLRSGSRLLSGARMGANTVLLEHTLVMAGDVIEEGCTIQGWPGEEFTGSRTTDESASIDDTA